MFNAQAKNKFSANSSEPMKRLSDSFSFL